MKEKELFEFNENIFKIVGKDTALLTAGDLSSFNTMTIAWATLGVIWGKNVITCYVRPSRHTYGFIEKADTFTITFYDDNYKNKLSYLGTHSGRDEDKVKKCNLTPVKSNGNSVYFEEARLTFVCKKIYFQDLDRDQITDQIKERYYPKKDFHRFYVGEIIQCLEK